jgi:thiol-disulfide isomerase/thioredoxin
MNTKNIYSHGRQSRSKFRLPRWPLFYLAISVICLSLFFLPACQKKTEKAVETPPAAKAETAAKTETVANWPPKVTQIDEQGLKDLLKPDGKPRLINFWATWCGPCREEFPDLVKIGADHKDKIDLITVTLDETSEINSSVPKFLTEMRSDTPAYLLKTRDQDAAIDLVSKDWQGALPFTILISADGKTIYAKQGKFDKAVLVAEIEKL